MTNREKILKTSEYDLLVKMNAYNETHKDACILDMLTNGATVNRCWDNFVGGCEECIAAWLNEEAE